MSKKRAPRTRAPKKNTRKGRDKPVAFSGAKDRERTRRTNRPEDVTFPEMGDLKDRIAMGHAKTYADEMFQSEEALDRATAAKQAVRSRMEKLNASHFTGHGYEFSRTPGEESFSARKLKRGRKPADTLPELEDEVDVAGVTDTQFEPPEED